MTLLGWGGKLGEGKKKKIDEGRKKKTLGLCVCV